jgi:spermidine dehydrogenase
LEIESPARYNQWAARLLKDIGVDLDAYRNENKANGELYRSLGLRGAHFFEKETFGVDRLVVAPPSKDREAEPRRMFSEEYLRNMPISEQAKRDLMRLDDPNQPDYMPGLSSAQKKERLARMSFRDYLLNVAKVDPQAYWFYMATGRGVFCVGGDALPALFAWQMLGGAGGFAGLKLDPSPEGLLADLPGGQHGRQIESGESVHFPDGNATLARLLVRWLIPDAIPGTTQDAMGTAHVKYDLLDRASNATRIRLNSMVLNVRHEGEGGQTLRGPGSRMCDGMLEHVHSIFDTRASRGTEGGSCVQCEGPDRLHQCISEELESVCEARYRGCRVSDDVPRQRRIGGAVRPRRLASCTQPR